MSSRLSLTDSLPHLALALFLSAPAVAQSSLWASDDVTKTITNVTLEGAPLSSFPSGAVSGLAIDPVDKTIWAAKEGFNRIVQFDRAGNELSVILGGDISPDMTSPEGVAVDYGDATLWVVDDLTFSVYNAGRTGGLISSFPTSMYDANAVSPQSIAADPNGSLWITDNLTDRIYNVDTAGGLLSSFHADSYAQSANNPQGITVDDGDGTLWITDRITQTAYHVTREGQLIASFDTNGYGSANPTGIAFDYVAPKGIDLGLAGDYAMLGCWSVGLFNSSTRIAGDVGLGAGGVQLFANGTIDGDYDVDPEAYVPYWNGVDVTGTTTVQPLSSTFQDAFDFSAAAKELESVKSYGYIYYDETITGESGTNVVDVYGINLKYGDTLTLSGDSSTVFIINVSGYMRVLYGARIELAGGVSPENVVFNVHGCGYPVFVYGNADAVGTILAPNRSVYVAYGSDVEGAVISGRSATVWGGAQITKGE